MENPIDKKAKLASKESINNDVLCDADYAAEVYDMCAGEVNRVPLCVSLNGDRAWARRREPPYSLEYLDLNPIQKWKPIETTANGDFSLGAYGMTRCGANFDFICLQNHQDGQFFFTNASVHRSFYLHVENDQCQLSLDIKPETSSVATAIGVVGCGYGAAILIEDYGLVFVYAFTDEPTLVDIHRSTTLETTIGIDANFIGIVEGSCVGLYDITNLNSRKLIPIPGLDLA
jgi:hypothetical protein